MKERVLQIIMMLMLCIPVSAQSIRIYAPPIPEDENHIYRRYGVKVVDSLGNITRKSERWINRMKPNDAMDRVVCRITPEIKDADDKYVDDDGFFHIWCCLDEKLHVLFFFPIGTKCVEMDAKTGVCAYGEFPEPVFLRGAVDKDGRTIFSPTHNHVYVSDTSVIAVDYSRLQRDSSLAKMQLTVKSYDFSGPERQILLLSPADCPTTPWKDCYGSYEEMTGDYHIDMFYEGIRSIGRLDYDKSLECFNNALGTEDKRYRKSAKYNIKHIKKYKRINHVPMRK